jgi:hypothetical protein
MIKILFFLTAKHLNILISTRSSDSITKFKGIKPNSLLTTDNIPVTKSNGNYRNKTNEAKKPF